MITPVCPRCAELHQLGYPDGEECALHPAATRFWRMFGGGRGAHPMTADEGELIDRLAHGESVPAHSSACTSVPLTCWHGQAWHKGRSGRLGPCQVPGCQCLMFVSQLPGGVPAAVPEAAR
jgi:hypothetical protein